VTMKIWTIGFTKKSAEEFFSMLQSSGAKRLLDVRLNNSSQLAGFSKRDDLEYFLKAICGMEYRHLPELAPAQEMLEAYKGKLVDWAAYEVQFNSLMSERKVEQSVEREVLEGAVLLCSEPKPDKCHRRLVAEGAAVQVLRDPFSFQSNIQQCGTKASAKMRASFAPVDASKGETSSQAPSFVDIDTERGECFDSGRSEVVGIVGADGH
jgi:hypothetical protein